MELSQTLQLQSEDTFKGTWNYGRVEVLQSYVVKKGYRSVKTDIVLRRKENSKYYTICYNATSLLKIFLFSPLCTLQEKYESPFVISALIVSKLYLFSSLFSHEFSIDV
jgi:hypothetical protein